MGYFKIKAWITVITRAKVKVVEESCTICRISFMLGTGTAERADLTVGVTLMKQPTCSFDMKLCLVSACSVWHVKFMLKSFPHTNHHSHLWSVILFACAFLCLHFYLLHFKHLKLFPIYACAFPLYSMCFVLRDHIISLTLGSLLLICRWKLCFVLVYHSAVFCAALIHLFSVAYLEPELATEG